MPLTCLVSDIVEAILGGRPKGLRLAEMPGNGPLEWEEQRSHWLSRVLVDGFRMHKDGCGVASLGAPYHDA